MTAGATNADKTAPGLSATDLVPRPGRLGEPTMTMREDPRADPRMVAALAPFELDLPPQPMPLPLDAPREQLLEVCAAMEQGMEQLFGSFTAGLEPVAGVTTETIAIPRPGGGEITAYVHRPTDADGVLPGVVHLHGGGMVLLEAAGPAYRHWRDMLAASGLVVIGVEFRNGAGKHGSHPYPGGLDDCVTATRWVLDHADELGIGKVIVSGESGGGNLTLSTVLRAKREGWVDRIAGAYALCPFIHGDWGNPPPELASQHENEGYFLSRDMMATLAVVYDPTGEHNDEPTCWPLKAGADDVAGLPPHVISVNEVDPLRDEGLAYLRLLLANGVSAVGRVVVGTCHGADVLMPATLPDVTAATVRDIKGFADSL
ncbi:MAG TPA: alpha/beta hydrolase fold domain-containing protein [Pseudonocardia sp.]|jgi:acetyl esterase/lipase|nr:alpha/beta hydrolase fold domain-containing protein [Pseudonocardia sp.]